MKSFDIVSLSKVISGLNNPKLFLQNLARRKLFEELATEIESLRTISKSYYVIVPEIMTKVLFF